MTPVDVSDAQAVSDHLEQLIDSLATADDPNTVRPQIQTEGLTLHSMLISLANPAAVSAHEAAAASFDAQINWAICADSSVRPKVIGAARECEPINSLVERIRGWAHCLGTVDWATTPEVPAWALINYLATYRSITNT